MGCLGRKLCKSEGLRLISRTHLEEAVVAASICNPSTKEVETGRSPGLSDQAA